MKKLLCVAILCVACGVCAQQPVDVRVAQPLAAPVEGGDGDIIVAAFEGEDYGAWTVEGTAFGKGPARGTLPGQMKVSGFIGKGLVNSFNGGDGATGTLTSPPFKIERGYLAFLIGGGGHPGLEMNLLVGGKAVRTATGPNVVPGGSEALEPAMWDVRDLLGKEARIQIVDRATGGWGHINVDHIVATDTRPRVLQNNVTASLTPTKRWMLLPVKNGGKMRRMEVRLGDDVLRAFDIEFAEDTADWWAPLDVSAWQGKALTVWVSQLAGEAAALEKIRFADAPADTATVYKEPLRAQLHFTPRLGWCNDPNGLSFYNGEYHLFFQHNPYGAEWGNMHWGHAVSKDLIHWQEISPALYPDALGTMFSGSAVVDWKNTSGFGTGGKPPQVLIYTAAGDPFTQCIAYSTDGRTYTKHAGNPVVKNISGGNRDPKVIWHEPTQRWVMVLYVWRDERHTTEFLTSPNLKDWTHASTLPGDANGGYLFECPDLFELPVAGGAGTRWVTFGANGEYAVGAFDGKTFTPEAERLRGHFGTHHYAAQTFSDLPDKRRVIVGWLQAHVPGMPFNHAMTLPRELGLTQTPDGIRLTHRPVKEIEALRVAETKIASAEALAGFSAELMEVRLAFAPSADAIVKLALRGIPFVYDAEKKTLTVSGHTAPFVLHNGRVELILYIDRTAVEVFSQDGLFYASRAVTPKADALGAALTVERGEAKDVSGTAYTLKSCWE
ncbi:MAG: GH32 C-terminal domain-containing protein [Kiritimatiellaeota bacterium]|nr:GH32 C-terminal domain-containing protein [Kiritimatiellota bacterium]